MSKAPPEVPKSELKAVFFDQDGVIVDTERDGHRVAFNRAFRQFGIPLEWSAGEYHRLLQVGGGKERLRFALGQNGPNNLLAASSPAQQEEKIRALHQRKTDILLDMLRSGVLPLRPGIRRLMQQIQAAGLKLGIATTSNERTAEMIASTMLRGIRFDFILAGDVVQHKKPAADIYRLAIAKAAIQPQEGLVFEDSHIGVSAAVAAGLRVVATVNDYTAGEDLSGADLVLSCLGNEKQTAEVLYAKAPFVGGTVHWAEIVNYFEEVRG